MSKKPKRISVIDERDKAYNYLNDLALTLQRSIVDSDFYVGSDYRLYRKNPVQGYEHGAVKLIRNTLGV